MKSHSFDSHPQQIWLIRLSFSSSKMFAARRTGKLKRCHDTRSTYNWNPMCMVLCMLCAVAHAVTPGGRFPRTPQIHSLFARDLFCNCEAGPPRSSARFCLGLLTREPSRAGRVPGKQTSHLAFLTCEYRSKTNIAATASAS